MDLLPSSGRFLAEFSSQQLRDCGLWFFVVVLFFAESQLGAPLRSLRLPKFLITLSPPSSNQQRLIRFTLHISLTCLLPRHSSGFSRRTFSTLKVSCDQIGPTKVVQDHLSILRCVIIFISTKSVWPFNVKHPQILEDQDVNIFGGPSAYYTLLLRQ